MSVMERDGDHSTTNSDPSSSKPTSTFGSTSGNDRQDTLEEDSELIAEQGFTGFFRDGKRRIDIVLAVEDKKNIEVEKLKIQFLLKSIEMGMEVEVESGVAMMHKHMVFIKVHAPDKIIEEFGHYFDMRKFFKESHVEFMDPPKRFYSFLLPCPGIKLEGQMIKLVRAQYPGPLNYSTLERSCIVYKMLQMVPFGEPENYIGLNRLLEYNIVLDAYPLHDGPYYFVPEQDISEPNGRQVLFHHWVGMRNLSKTQPIHMIREYFGERIGFFFSYFDFYIRALSILAIFGNFAFTGGFYDTSDAAINKAACTNYSHNFSTWFYRIDWKYDIEEHSFGGDQRNLNSYHYMEYYRGVTNEKKELYAVTWQWTKDWLGQEAWVYIYKYTTKSSTGKTHRVWNFQNVEYTDLPVCPKCRDFRTCPFRNLTSYCPEVKLKNLIDNPYAIIYSFFSCFWAILFVLLWRRKELYLSWLWEVNEDASSNVIRPEYRISYRRRNAISRVKRYTELLMKTILRILLPILFIVTYVLGVIPILIYVKYKMLSKTLVFEKNWHFMTRTYVVLLLLAMINAVVILFFDKVSKMISFFLVSLMNHRTEDTYEKHLVIKWFGFSFINNFTFIFFFAFFKGLLYTFPGSLDNWYKPYGIGMMNCGLLSCIDELWIIFVFTTFSKRFFEEFSDVLTKNITDYNQGKSANETLPCWEKEFRLVPLTDDFIMQKYMDLMMQMAVATLFVTVCPLVPLFVMIVSVWDIRYYAELLTKRYRRPLITKTWGLGAWCAILAILPYVAAICNSVSIAVNYNLIDKFAYSNKFNHTKFFKDYYMGFYNTTDYVLFGDVGRADDPNSTFTEFIDYGWRPLFCMFPGKYRREIESYADKRVKSNTYQSWVGKWYVHWYQVLFIIFYEQIILVMGALLNYLISSDPEDIEDTRAVEETVRNYAMRQENIKKSK